VSETVRTSVGATLSSGSLWIKSVVGRRVAPTVVIETDGSVPRRGLQTPPKCVAVLGLLRGGRWSEQRRQAIVFIPPVFLAD
jgi:hypothetical protein